MKTFSNFAELFEDVQHDFDDGVDVKLDVFCRVRDTIAEDIHQQLKFNDISNDEAYELLSVKPNVRYPLMAYAAATVEDFCYKEKLNVPIWVKQQKPLSLAEAYIDFLGPKIIFDKNRKRNYGNTSNIFRNFGCFVDNNHTSFR